MKKDQEFVRCRQKERMLEVLNNLCIYYCDYRTNGAVGYYTIGRGFEDLRSDDIQRVSDLLQFNRNARTDSGTFVIKLLTWKD